MKTVDKALKVLDQFSLEKTEIGLSELARMAELDKAATRRLLVALISHGFIEQSAETKKYRLGQGFLRLARVREATVPMAAAAQEVADWLSEEVKETVHISVPAGSCMATLAYRLPHKGNVINISPGEQLFYHATAAGFAYMAFATDQTLTRVLGLKRTSVTAKTPTAKADILALIKQTRRDGYARSRNTFEDGVASVAMPFFLGQPDPAGTISIAVPASNMDDARRAKLLPFLKQGIARMEQSLTGHITA
jgi:DNA-binding IclR family transcriptional regulator